MNDKGMKWIPCSERLPKEGGTYIVTAKENGISHVTFAKWQNRFQKWSLIGKRAYWKIIAWMPLPDDYSTESDEIRIKKEVV